MKQLYFGIAILAAFLLMISCDSDDGGSNGAADGDSDTDSDAGGDTGSGGGGTEDSGEVFHVFLLMGQSNMVGAVAHEETDENTDERLQVLGMANGCGHTINEWSTATPPLHSCYLNPVGPGDWFGKTLLEKLPDGHTIGLVPTAVNGEAIETFIEGGVHHEDILEKIDIASKVEDMRFEGIIFHQGESDTGDSFWPGKVKQLYDEVKAAMGIDHDIPFIAGELLYDGCCDAHNLQVNKLPDEGDNFYVVSAEGLVVDPNDYPADNATKWNAHFDHDSVVELGKRYGNKMIEVLGW